MRRVGGGWCRLVGGCNLYAEMQIGGRIRLIIKTYDELHSGSNYPPAFICKANGSLFFACSVVSRLWTSHWPCVFLLPLKNRGEGLTHLGKAGGDPATLFVLFFLRGFN